MKASIKSARAAWQAREELRMARLLAAAIPKLLEAPLGKTVRQPMVRGCGLPRRAGVKQGSSPAGAVGRAVTVQTLRNLKARSTATSSNPAAPHAAEQLI